MAKAILTVIITLLFGIIGLLLGLMSATPVPEFGAITAIAAASGLMVYFHQGTK